MSRWLIKVKLTSWSWLEPGLMAVIVKTQQLNDVVLIDASQSGIKPLPARPVSIQSWWLSFGKVQCSWAWQLPCWYMQVMFAAVCHLCPSACELELDGFVSPPLQTWTWTVGLIMWRWCGRRTDARLTPRSTVWVTASPRASRSERLSSAWRSMTATSGCWWVLLLPASWKSTGAPTHTHTPWLYLSHRLLGISWCTPMIWLTLPLIRTLCFSAAQSSVRTTGGCSKYFNIKW